MARIFPLATYLCCRHAFSEVKKKKRNAEEGAERDKKVEGYLYMILLQEKFNRNS